MTAPRFLMLSFGLLLVGCASHEPYTRPGIQPVEATVMKKSYYWNPKRDQKTFTNAQIQKLFRQSTDPKFNGGGEYSEFQTAQLVWALAAVGDKHFADLLSQEPRDVQRTTVEFISSLWTYDGLRYPLTEEFQTACPASLNANPGIQPEEAVVLKTRYHWNPKGSPKNFTEKQIQQIIYQTIGSSSGTYTYEMAKEREFGLVLALATVGDQCFATVLSKEPGWVRHSVFQDIAFLWTHCGLRYPATETLQTGCAPLVE